MSNSKEGTTKQGKALERVLSALPANILQGSARLASYFAAAATIYLIAGGDAASVTALSPILGRLIERIGGDVLAGFLDKVANTAEDTLSTTDIREFIESTLSGFDLDDVLTEKEFHRVIRLLQQRNADRYQDLSQSILLVLDWLRRLHPADPAPLSPIPRSARPLLTTSRLVGRDADLAWLQETKVDRLLIGQPGIGKTFLLYRLAAEGYGLFVLSRDRGEIAHALKEEKPEIVIVDDAHVERELLLDLRQLRQGTGLDFAILASSWPGAREIVAEALSLNESRIHELASLDPDQIVEVIKIAGLPGPNFVIREIREQANGRAGLAVTLTQIYLEGGGKDIWEGDVLKRTLLSLEPLREQPANVIIGAFSLGGEAGMPYKAIAHELKVSLLDLRQHLSNLAAAGIISEIDRDHLSVQPLALRHAAIRDTFFANYPILDVRSLLQYAPSTEEAALSLIGAQARGADIPQELMISQLEKTNSIAAWMRYAASGSSQKEWTLQNHPEKIIHSSPTSLRMAPEVVVPLMLEQAVGDHRPLHANPSHPMRMIQDWVQSAYPGTSGVLERRELLLQKTLEWLETNGDSDVGLRALQIAVTPKYQTIEPDPGSGNSAILTNGLITIDDMREIVDFWQPIFNRLKNIQISAWEPIYDLVFEWAYPEVGSWGHAPEETGQFMRSFTIQVLQDIVSLAKEHLGILHWVMETVQHLNLGIEVPVDKEFMLLYPIVEPKGWIDSVGQHQQAVAKLAVAWSNLPPILVAERLGRFEAEAELANFRWPRLTPYLCTELAQRVENAFEWFQAFKSVGLRNDLIMPFQRKDRP